MLFSLSFALSVPLGATHGNINYPPAWQDRDGEWTYNGGQCAAGCKGENATIPAEGCICESYSNYTHIPGEPTIPPMSPLKTYTDACVKGTGVESCCQDFCQDPKNQMAGQPCEGCDWTRKMPWRAPGSAPVFSPCGYDGGNPDGCPVGNPGQDCAGGGYGHGPDSRSLPGNSQPVVWTAGGVEEVSWGVSANHGGGYQYRLCPKPAISMDLTEECFQRTPLQFVGSTQWLQRAVTGNETTTRVEIPAMRTVTGTTPTGSQWTRNPIPACLGNDGGSHPSQKNCTGVGTQFPPPIEGAEGFKMLPWNIIDNVHIPNLPTGDYVLGFRYDCEQTPQVWQQCGDVRIVMPSSLV